MEEKRGIFTHFSGLIRIAVAVLLLIILTFFLIRWAQQRQGTSKQAEKVAAETKEKDTKNAKETQKSDDNTAEPVPMPRGVADSEISPPAPTTAAVPSTGVDSTIIATLVFASITAYLACQQHVYRQERAKYSL